MVGARRVGKAGASRPWYFLRVSSRRKLTRSAAFAVTVAALSALGASGAAGVARAALWPDVPDRLKNELASPDVQRRRAAAADLANLPKDEALVLLQKAVTDEDVDVRLIAASVAARRGIAAVTDAILPWLTDADPRLREGACEFFAELPQTKVVKVLARALGDSVATVRLAAVRALGASASSDAVAPLLARLDDSNSKIRLAVARALAKLGDVRAVTPLVSKVQDEASEVRQAVVRALGELGDVRAAPALVIALSDQAVEVRVEALAALGRMRASESVPSIAPLTVDAKKPGSVEVRRAALAALGRIGNAAAVDAIIRAFGTFEDATAGIGSSPAREAAITAGAIAGPVLLARLRDSTLAPTAATITAGGNTATPGNVASSAAWVLGELRTEGAGDVIVKAMRRGEVPPAIALHALASLGDPTQLPICLEQVASPEKAVRSEALVAAARLLDPERPDGRAVEPLLASLELAQTPEDRAEIAMLLGRTGAERVAPVLAGLTSAKDEHLKVAAIDALGTLGAAGGGAALEKLLDDPSGIVRLHAAIALARAGGPEQVEKVLLRLTTAAEADRLAVVIAASGLLERHGDAKAVALASKAMASGVGAERDLLVVGLGRAKDPSATATLSTLLAGAGSDVDTRRAIAMALGARVGDAAAAKLVRTLATDVDPTVRAQAAWALGSLGDATDGALLDTLTKDSALSVAGNAAAALGRVFARAPKVSAPPAAICRALVDDRPYVRANALGALLQLARASRPATCDDGHVERRLLAEDGNEVVRTFAARLEGALLPAATAPDAKEVKDAKSPARVALERCTLGDPSGAVAAVCRETLRAHDDEVAPKRTSTLVVFVSGDDGGAPVPRSAYALERPEGLLHLGTSDRRGAVVELLLGKGIVRLRVASPAAVVAPRG